MRIHAESAPVFRPARAWLLFLIGLSVAGLIVPGVAREALSAQDKPSPAPGLAKPGIVKITPKMPANALAGRPDTDLVELSDGRRVRLGDIRRLTAAAKRIRASAPGSRFPKAFRTPPAATGAPLKNSADLAGALKRSEGETVVLPSGRRVTVGMIRLLQPEVEKRLGRPLSAAAAPAGRSGPAVKVDAKSDWKSLLQKPDGTVLEAPNGRQITVGELKQALAASPSPPRRPPATR